MLLHECRERIDRGAPAELRDNLLAVTQVMTKLRYNNLELLNILGGRKVMFESPLIQEIVAETEARSQKQAIATVLKARFGRLPRKLTAAINCVKDHQSLTQVLSLASTCSDLDAFGSVLSEGQ
jgi:hypothetical protein